MSFVIRYYKVGIVREIRTPENRFNVQKLIKQLYSNPF